jgi:hypothetical protein
VVKQRNSVPRGRIVKDKYHLKKVAIAVILASVGLVVYTLVAGYTYQAKQKVELQNSLHQLQVEKVKSTEDKKKIEELTKQLQAKREAATALAEAQTVAVSHAQALQTPLSLVVGSHTDWMAQAGIAASDYGYVDFIVMHEGSWCALRYNGDHRPCGVIARDGYLENHGAAYGVCQALPASKMASAGADWQTNPVTQLKWCNGYAIGRYGSWAEAYNAWISKSWW